MHKYLRIFLSLSLLLTVFGWAGIWPDSWYLPLSFIHADMSGVLLTTQQPSDISLLLHDFKTSFAVYVVAIAMLIFFSFNCIGKWPTLTSLGLILITELIGYSAGNRKFWFEIYSYVIIAYFSADFMIVFFKHKFPKLSIARLARDMALGWIGCVYLTSAISKLTISGFSWFSDSGVAMIMMNKKFLVTIINYPILFPDFDWLFQFFKNGTWISSALLIFAFLIECFSIFIPQMKSKQWIYTIALLLMNTMFGVFTGIFTPVWILLVVLGLPWYRLKNEGSLYESHLPGYSKYILAFSIVPLLISFTAPLEKYGTHVTVFPFSRFDMFSRLSKNSFEYYYPDLSQIPAAQLKTFTSAQLWLQGINNLAISNTSKPVSSDKIATVLCKYLQESWLKSLGLTEIPIRKHHIYFQKPEGAQSTDSQILKCNLAV